MNFMRAHPENICNYMTFSKLFEICYKSYNNRFLMMDIDYQSNEVRWC